MHVNQKKEIINALAIVCDSAYSLEEGLNPKFLREAWADQVRVATTVLTGNGTPYDEAVAAGFADNVSQTPSEWAGDVVALNHNYVTARIQLAGVYKQAAAAIMAVPDAPTMIATIQGLEPAAIQAATQIGSTDANDEKLTVAIQQWVAFAVELASPPIDDLEDIETMEADTHAAIIEDVADIMADDIESIDLGEVDDSDGTESMLGASNGGDVVDTNAETTET